MTLKEIVLKLRNEVGSTINVRLDDYYSATRIHNIFEVVEKECKNLDLDSIEEVDVQSFLNMCKEFYESIRKAKKLDNDKYKLYYTLGTVYERILIVEDHNSRLDDQVLFKDMFPDEYEFIVNMIKERYGEYYLLKLKLGGVI